jgi:hypothetical protein
MTGLFEGTRPGTEVTRGDIRFELPILYFREDTFALFFTADLGRLRARMPTPNLKPVPAGPGRGLVVLAAFNYLETSIGPYGEIAVGIPVVHRKAAPPLLPALLESAYPGFGILVLHLPVTTQTARASGRSVWGYPKFVGDMAFTSTPEHLECALSEGGRHVLSMRVPRGGMPIPERRPLVTYTVREGDLVRTTVAQRGVVATRVGASGAFLDLGGHPMAEDVASLGLSRRPLLSRHYLERQAVLPEGAVVEAGVRPLEGYAGTDREGTVEVRYPPRI